MRLKEMLAKLECLDARATELDAQTKAAKAEAAAWEHEVHLEMEREGYEPGDDTTFHGTRWGRQVDYYAKVQDPLEFNAWAEANAPHLIQPSPRKALLNQLVQRAHEDGTQLPPGLAESPKLWVSRRAR